MHEYYISISCPECGGDLVKGLCLTNIEQNGRPVIDLGTFSCETFVCEKCGTVTYTGDTDSMMEYEVPDEWYVCKECGAGFDNEDDAKYCCGGYDDDEEQV